VTDRAVLRFPAVRRADDVPGFIVRLKHVRGTDVVARPMRQAAERGQQQDGDDAGRAAQPSQGHHFQISILSRMFPVSDVIPSRRTPLATLGLIALNGFAFLYQLQLDRVDMEALVRACGVVPAAFAWPSLITSSFLHAGWLQFGANMLYLWLFGDNLEDALGRWRFLMVYFACGAVAALAYAATHPSTATPMIGAGGAVAGVMGAYLVLFPRSRVLTAVFLIVYVDLIEVPAVFFLAVWFLIQFFSDVGSAGVHTADGAAAFWAHIAGLVAGATGGAYARFGTGSLQRYWREEL
jgi:membrane associated rhomboid family serine protease